MKELKNQIQIVGRCRYLSDGEIDLLLTELGKVNGTVHGIVLLMLKCGLRLRDMLNLKGRDLDFDRDLINISGSMCKIHRKVLMKEVIKSILKKKKPEDLDESVFKGHRQRYNLMRISRMTTGYLQFNADTANPMMRISYGSLRRTYVMRAYKSMAEACVPSSGP